MRTVKPETADATRKVADNVILVIAARLSMVLALPTIGFMAWLYHGWQEERFATLRTEVVEAQRSAEAAEKKVSDVSARLVAVETRQTQEAQAGDRFQRETLARLDRMQDALIQLSNSVSALTATVQTLAEHDVQRLRPR